MKRILSALIFLLPCVVNITHGQQYIDKTRLFTDTAIVNATLTMNFKKMFKGREKEGYVFPATFTCKLQDGMSINDQVDLEVRGHFRREYCYIPPLKFIYKNNSSSAFYHLKSLKLVNTCSLSASDDQNILKEFLVYKIYNLISGKSFRARLLNLSYADSAGNKKTVTRHAFLLEDIRDLAKRNDCADWSDKKYRPEATDRPQMTIFSIFEYMIGNTDWSVQAAHNVKLIHSKSDSTSRPFVVPYDFDYSGLVNTSYAVPDESLHIASVRERVYRGFPRSMEEFDTALQPFKKQKENIYALINNFNLLTPHTKKEMTDYLDDFYEVINNPASLKHEFLTNAELR